MLATSIGGMYFVSEIKVKFDTQALEVRSGNYYCNNSILLDQVPSRSLAFYDIPLKNSKNGMYHLLRILRSSVNQHLLPYLRTPLSSDRIRRRRRHRRRGQDARPYIRGERLSVQVSVTPRRRSPSAQIGCANASRSQTARPPSCGVIQTSLWRCTRPTTPRTDSAQTAPGQTCCELSVSVPSRH